MPDTLFTNANLILDGFGERQASFDVLVKGSYIQAVSARPLDRAHATIIDVAGRTLMPGLIDAHWHSAMAAIPLSVLMTADVGYINLVAATSERETLMRGFTSVRDVSGPTFGLKRAIDEGFVDGPRIWPSGAMISQSGGHGDFRMPFEVPAAPNAPLSRGQAINGGVIADGPDEVRKRVREQLMLGASQIKLAAGGGVAAATCRAVSEFRLSSCVSMSRPARMEQPTSIHRRPSQCR
jgi:imidazolonepropionase-like amidohydrolase